MSTSPIYAMWLRQLKKYWRSKPRMIGSLGQPLLFLLALGFGMGSIFQKAVGGSYIQFLAPGIIAMTILFTAMFNGIEIIWDRQFGFLKETLVAPVPRWKIMFGRTIGGATVSIFQGVFILAISLLVGFKVTNWSLLPVAILFMVMMGLLFTAIGTAIATRLEDMQAFPLIINFLIMPLFFLSGALFPIDSAPTALKVVAYLNPLTYCIDGLRAALGGVSHFSIWLDLIIVLDLVVLSMFIGTKLFEKIKA
ncbi:MAG: ABC transporter permease [Nanoarchaeota archaeon]